MANSNPNRDGLKPIEKGDSERARELQKIGVQKRKENKIKNELIKSAILKELSEKDLQEIAKGLIARSKSNYHDLEVMRDTIGEKPTTKVEADVGLTDIRVDIDE